VFRNDNVLISTFNSTGTELPAVFEPGHHRARLQLPGLRLLEGEYNLVGYLLDATNVHFYDHRQHDRPLMIRQEQNQPGVVRLDHTFDVQPLDGAS